MMCYFSPFFLQNKIFNQVSQMAGFWMNRQMLIEMGCRGLFSGINAYEFPNLKKQTLESWSCQSSKHPWNVISKEWSLCQVDRIMAQTESSMACQLECLVLARSQPSVSLDWKPFQDECLTSKQPQFVEASESEIKAWRPLGRELA